MRRRSRELIRLEMRERKVVYTDFEDSLAKAVEVRPGGFAAADEFTVGEAWCANQISS